METPSSEDDNLVMNDMELCSEKTRKGRRWRKQLVLRVINVVTLLFTWISSGLYLEISGPTLKDIILRLCSTYEKVSNAVSGRSVGKFIGVVIGGILVDKFSNHCYLVLGILLVVASISTITFPWVNSVDVLWIFYCVLGACLGLQDIAGQRTVFMIFKERATSPLHIVHLGYGVGAFLAPLIANPFLADTGLENLSMEFQNFPNVTVPVNITRNRTSSGCLDPALSSMEYAYIIIGVIAAIIAIPYFVYQFTECCAGIIDTPEKDKESKGSNMKSKLQNTLKLFNPATCADGNFCFGSSILLIFFVKYFFQTGLDRAFGTFLRSFAIDQLHFKKDMASYLNTVYWISYAVSRLIVFIIANLLSVQVLLLIESFGLVICMLILTVFGLQSSTVLWVVVVATGLLFGSAYPTGLCWGNAHIEMTGVAMTWIIFGSSFGGLAYLKTGGILYDQYGPPTLAYACLLAAIIQCLLDCVLCFLACLKPKLTKSRDDDGGGTNEEKLVNAEDKTENV